MPWNWQLPKWPHFHYDIESVLPKEKQLLLELGGAAISENHISPSDRINFACEILTQEGVESSKIEGEFLDRESLRSSIKSHFGLKAQKKAGKKESAMAGLLLDVYQTYNDPLTHEMVARWHALLFEKSSEIEAIGRYRQHEEPMQIVSHRLDRSQVFFEAPPSKKVFQEMDRFIAWFNSSRGSSPIIGRSAIAHLYFESIHPFEDGNGRIGRVLVEKILSQEMGRPVLAAVSKILEARKKRYYTALGTCNTSLKADSWVSFFAEALVDAVKESSSLLNFLVEKARFFTAFSNQINSRQEKVLLRMFEEGPEGFKGGLSRENYIAISKTSLATATRDLSELVEIGALRRRGELRYTRYTLPF
jgi:Fic family protein